ncbi:MAG TPA: hypothetical protein VM327_06915 [Candidatus Thermoplasmatota archaeon]|nr:hypothetical protein [Candidatus Thermoplasmatota archaeon]
MSETTSSPANPAPTQAIADDRTFFQKAFGRPAANGTPLTTDQRVQTYWLWAIFSLVAIVILPLAAVVGGIVVLVLLRKLTKQGGITGSATRRAKQAKAMAIVAIVLAVVATASTNSISPAAPDQTCLGEPGDQGILCFPNEVAIQGPAEVAMVGASSGNPTNVT